MAVERFRVDEDRIDSFLTGFFGVALALSSGVLGYELGAMAAGSSTDPLIVATLAPGALASAVGLRRVGGGCCLGACRLR